MKIVTVYFSLNSHFLFGPILSLVFFCDSWFFPLRHVWHVTNCGLPKRSKSLWSWCHLRLVVILVALMRLVKEHNVKRLLFLFAIYGKKRQDIHDNAGRGLSRKVFWFKLREHGPFAYLAFKDLPHCINYLDK